MFLTSLASNSAWHLPFCLNYSTFKCIYTLLHKASYFGFMFYCARIFNVFTRLRSIFSVVGLGAFYFPSFSQRSSNRFVVELAVSPRGQHPTSTLHFFFHRQGLGSRLSHKHPLRLNGSWTLRKRPKVEQRLSGKDRLRGAIEPAINERTVYFQLATHLPFRCRVILNFFAPAWESKHDAVGF